MEVTANEPLGEDAPQADHIRFLFAPNTALALLVGHRRRFASTVATLTPEELAAPSRCEGWTVADVLRHGVWVDAATRHLWTCDESPLEGFDPRSTPNAFVQADRAIPDEEIRRRYLSSTEAMIVDLESVDPVRFGDPSWSPAGRVPWWMVAVHLGWDSTIHERDVLLPLDRFVDTVPGESMLYLAYSLVLASSFEPDPLCLQIGTVRLRSGDGPVTASATTGGADDNDRTPDDPTTVLAGEPEEVIDALSGRLSLTEALHGDAAVIERLGGLARYFTSSG
jgi:uncharacterized protein (TIGR03083 family)